MAETLLIMAVFVTVIIFATLQVALISFTSMIAFDAVNAAGRSAAVSVDINTAKKNAMFSGGLVFSSVVNFNDSIPLKNSVTEVKVNTGVKTSRTGNKIHTVFCIQRYLQKIMFSSIIAPLLGKNDLFILTGGRMGKFFGGGAPATAGRAFYKGVKSCPIVISPEPDYYYKPYPGSNKW